jgi:hypothetical protein
MNYERMCCNCFNSYKVEGIRSDIYKCYSGLNYDFDIYDYISIADKCDHFHFKPEFIHDENKEVDA